MGGGRAIVFAAFLLAACEVGDGSDIGPKLPKLPDASCKVVVADDQGRGVVGATVSIGNNLRAVTGRNGRGDLLADPRGRALVAVDAANAAAVAGDTLAGYQVATTIVGPDLPAVLYVPDMPASASASLALGTQASPTTITSVRGARLVVGAGSSVGATGGGSPVDVRLGDLQAQHLPGDLPPATAGAWLFGGGLWIDPVGVSFLPGAGIDVPDDLGLGGGGTARLFHLDPATGEWGEVAVTPTAGGGRIVANGAIASGGLYVFGAATSSTTVTGRIVDGEGRGVPGALVVVDQWKTVADGSGWFRVDGVPAALADGSPRSAAVEWFAGGTWLPVRAALAAPVVPGAVDLGNLVLDSLPAGNIRVQQVLQGRAELFRPSRLSSLRGDVALATAGDGNGHVLFEDVPAEYFGFQDGRAIDSHDVLYGQSVGFLEVGTRWLDAYQFLFERDWYLGGRQSRTYVSDALGGGPLEDAGVVQGIVPGQGRVGFTSEGGTIFANRDYAGRATATRRSVRDGHAITHAFSIEVPNGEHLELPLQRVLRTPLGAFDRHGLVAGSLTGVDPANQHALRVTRRLSLQEWWDEIVEGGPAPSAVPLDVDPAATHGAFVVGVPAVGGHLAAIEYQSPGGVETLQKVGIVADLVPVEGQRVSQDVALDASATAGFLVAGALLGAPPELDVAQLSLSLALQQPSGRIVDVARGLRGNHVVSGNDLLFTLPPLDGALAGNGWLALLDGSQASGGSTIRCSTLISLPRPSSLPAFPLGAVAFHAFPEISAPANGATVPATGFTVQLALPADALHGAIELRSESPTDTLLWQGLLHPHATQFVFVTLPADVATPLIPGRTWQLTVSAAFGDGPVSGTPKPYENLSTFAQSIGAVERGVTQVTRRTIQITTN